MAENDQLDPGVPEHLRRHLEQKPGRLLVGAALSSMYSTASSRSP